jgi:hypothetical protein
VKGKIALALVALAAGMVACGDAEDDAGTFGEVGPPTKTAPARSPRSNPDRSCASQGIDATRLREGTCTESSTINVVANRGGTLRLESLAATVDGIAVQPEIEGPDGVVRPEEGAFVRVTLTVENGREYAQRFDLGQTVLGVATETYKEAQEAEQAHAGSLAMRDEGRVEGGSTLRGDVIFDVPVELTSQLATSGRFFIANFGERPGEPRELTARERQEQELASSIGGSIVPKTEVGQLRLFAGPEATSAAQ